MGRSINARAGAGGDLIPIGGFSAVFRSGEMYKAVGEVVPRSAYPELSAAFPRNGSLISVQRSMPPGSNFAGLAFGLGVFVMLLSTGVIYTSPDGEDWTQRGTLPPITSRSYTSLAFGNGRFVAIAGGPSGQTTTCYVTTDLLNWTAGTMPNFRWNAITYGTQFVAVAYNDAIAATSTDGITWTQRALPKASYWAKVAYGGGVYVALGTGTDAASSTDGANWTARTLPAITANAFTDVSYGNSAFVAVTRTSAEIARSTDGVSWALSRHNVSGGTEYLLKSVAFGNGMHLAVSSDGRSLASYDGGQTWVKKTTVGVSSGATAYGNGRFVAVPDSGTGGASGAVIFAENLTTSDDLYLAGTAGQFVRVK